MYIVLSFAFLNTVEGRLGYIHVSGIDQGPHVTEEEREKKSSDVRSIHIGIGHKNYLMVAGTFQSKVLAYPGPESSDRGK